MFDSTCSPGSALPAGRRVPSEQEWRELWDHTDNGDPDWFADYDPALQSDDEIVELIADLIDDQSATNSSSKPSTFSRYVA